jgi:hypothetical protein
VVAISVVATGHLVGVSASASRDLDAYRALVEAIGGGRTSPTGHDALMTWTDVDRNGRPSATYTRRYDASTGTAGTGDAQTSG